MRPARQLTDGRIGKHILPKPGVIQPAPPVAVSCFPQIFSNNVDVGSVGRCDMAFVGRADQSEFG